MLFRNKNTYKWIMLRRVSMTIAEERILKEAILLIADMDQRLKDSYYTGEFTLEELHEYQKMINLLYIVYNRVTDVKNSYFIRSYLKIKGIKLKKNNIYMEFADNINALHGNIKEKKFKALQEKLVRFSGVNISVKCICCGKKEKYNGIGTVVKSSEELLTEVNTVGQWICSEECYNQLYTAS